VTVFGFLRRHEAVVWLATVALVAMGVASALSMPSAIYPEVEFPRVVVVARTGGAPPDVFLTAVTRPLEQALTTVLGVQRIRSKTIRGATEVSLQFSPGTDMWRALQLVESRTNEVRGALPPRAEIIVERVTTGSFPVLTFNVSGATDPRELRELAERVVRPALANVPGVGRIEVVGGDVREVEVVLDPEALTSLHLTPNDVAQRLRSAMGLVAVGRVDRDRQLVTLISDAEPKTLSDIRELPIVTTPTGGIVTLQSIAEVVEGSEDRTVRVGGPLGETVGLSVARLPGASTTEVVDRAILAVKALEPSLPPGVTIRPVYDQASLVHESMSNVRDAILLGILLCAGVIAFFLRNVRIGAIAAASVPVTLAIGFSIMRLCNQTLNLMSLGGMAVAIGLVVDDAIVVVEAISRHLDAGEPPGRAAETGTLELAPAVIGTTLTTVVVFLPLALLQGVVGDFFRALAFTVTSAVLVSLAVALVLVPLAARRVLPSAPPERAVRRFLPAYDAMIRRLAKHPGVAAIALLALCLGGAVAAPRVGQGFLPTMDEGAFVLDYWAPPGASLRETDRMLHQVEERLLKTQEVESYSRRTGLEMGLFVTEPNRGDYAVKLKPGHKRSTADVISDLRKEIATAEPALEIEFVGIVSDVIGDLEGSPEPIEIKLFSEDANALQAKAEEIESIIAKLHDETKKSGVVDTKSGVGFSGPAITFNIDPQRAARFGVNATDVANTVTTAMSGDAASAILQQDRLITVRVIFPAEVRTSLDKVRALQVRSATGALFRLDQIASIDYDKGQTEIGRDGLRQSVAVTGRLEGKDLGTAIAEIKTTLAKEVKLPPGMTMEYGGVYEEQQASFRQLAISLVLAVVLVFLTLLVEFRSFAHPVAIVTGAVLALGGVLLGLFITNTTLNVVSLMGMIMIVGIVAKNGILMLDAVEDHLAAGDTLRQALLRSGRRRFRPVLMTSLAAMLGMLPLALAFGAGSELLQPLAIAVIGGLTVALLLSLIVTPAVYALLRNPR